MSTVAVLFARRDSIYKTMPGCDVWDIDRDARLWPGGAPIVAHPPCRAWGSMAHLAKPRPDERELAIWAIGQIRTWGGVLEHPRASRLWPEMGLPMGRAIDACGGFSLPVNQSWWGHPCEKKTLLYVCGVDRSRLPPLPMSLHLPRFVIACGGRDKARNGRGRHLPRSQREVTPPAFAAWLVALARSIATAQRAVA